MRTNNPVCCPENMMSIDPARTALVLIDVQKGIVANTLAPHTSAQVVSRCAALAETCRRKGALIVLVTVGWHKGFADALSQPVDVETPRDPHGPAADFADIAAGLSVGPEDIHITKRQWGAFHGTELDLQLRRRGITTIILAGIATNLGVESTARAAWEHGYSLLFAEDATSSFTAEMHGFAMNAIFPRLGRVRSSAQIAAMFDQDGAE